VKELHAATTTSQIVFSPHGRQLLFARLASPTSTVLTIVDAATGAARYDTQFTFQTPPGSRGDVFDTAAWGFGPDSTDRTFAYLYVTGATTASWNLGDLARASTAPVYGVSSGATGSWKFSPCGDVVGITRQPNTTQVDAQLVRTLDGSAAGGSYRLFSKAAVAFHATTASHVASLGGVDVVPRRALTIAHDAGAASVIALGGTGLSNPGGNIP